MTRWLLFLAAFVTVAVAVFLAVSVETIPGDDCFRTLAGRTFRDAFCVVQDPDPRWPLRVTIAGSGVVIGLVLAAVGSRQR